MASNTSWTAKAWMTATLHTSSGACSCPAGCADCVYRSPSTFTTAGVNFLKLDSTSTLPSLYLDGDVVDGSSNLTACPSTEHMECLSCLADHYPVAFAGAFIVTGLVLTLRVGDNANAMQMHGGIATAAYQEEVRPFNDTARRPPFA